MANQNHLTVAAYCQQASELQLKVMLAGQHTTEICNIQAVILQEQHTCQLHLESCQHTLTCTFSAMQI